MVATAKLPPGEIAATADQRVFLHGLRWADYEIMLAIRGESAVPRFSFLKGTLEIMTPSGGHEGAKKLLARLVEAYADAIEVPLDGYGSWTLKNPGEERGAEPDECYVRGRVDHPEVPDLAIEVVWTSGGIDRLEIYRGLGVREVWFWREGGIRIFMLREEAYVETAKSEVLPELDLQLIARIMSEHRFQPDAVAALRAALAARRKPSKARRGPRKRR